VLVGSSARATSDATEILVDEVNYMSEANHEKYLRWAKNKKLF